LTPSRFQLLAYAAPALPLALLTLPFYIVVPTLYAEIGAPLAAVGLTLLAIRVLDAVTDPLAGVLADRWRRRLPRKLWFAVGVPIVTVSAAMLFLPPAQLDGIGYLALWATLLSLGWTIALVPYTAWGVELSTDRDGRTRVSAFRESATFIGTLVALVVPEIVKQSGVITDQVQIETLRVFAYAIAVGLPLTALAALFFTPEYPDRSTLSLDLASGLKAMASNRAFLLLLAAYLFNGLANGLPATLFLLFVTHRLGLADSTGVFLIVYFAAGLLSVPFWLWLSRRIAKPKAWVAGMVLACLGFLPALMLGNGDWTGFFMVCVSTGIAVGADLTLPASIQADVIEIDTVASGSERSASYMAAWSLATKLALALAVGIAFPVLAASGFEAQATAPQGLGTLATLYAGVPVVLKMIAIALVWRVRT
jgi:glycoside/pentoside/hexuronide:cation symporter, GPH family